MNLKNLIFSNVYKKNPSAFGLDISDFSIKIAQLKRKGKNFKLLSFNRESIPKGIIEEGEIKNEKELIGILKKVFKEAKGEKIKTPYAICSLSEQHGFIKMINLPKMRMEELKQAIKWEAEANIPLPIEDVYLDWQLVGCDDKSDHFDILINAVPKKIIDSYLRVLQKSGVEPIAFEIESVATVRSLTEGGFSKESIMIMDLGSSRTSFIIFAGDSIRFTSSISVSNQQMINDIALKLNVGQKEARDLKIKIGLDNEKENGKVFNVLVFSIEKLIDKIEECLTFYKEHHHSENSCSSDISKIIICGGGAYLKNLPQYLNARLKIPVVLGNPWVNILKQPIIKIPLISQRESLAYSTVLGLALRENLE
jgi:type IV pilus assembly protein PilM